MIQKKPTLLIAWSQDIHWRNLYASGLLEVISRSFSQIVLVGRKKVEIPPELSNVKSYGSRWFASDPIMNWLARIHQLRSFILDDRFEESHYRLRILKADFPVLYRLAKYFGLIFRVAFLLWTSFRSAIAFSVLRMGRFDLFVSHSYIWECYDCVFGLAFKLSRKPWASIVTQWDNPSTKGSFHLKPDFVFVWGNINSQEVVKFQHISKNSIVELSPPHFVRMLKANETKKPIKKQVLYVGVSAVNYPYESQFLDCLIDLFSEDRELKEVNLVVRPHPNDKTLWDERIRNNLNIQLDTSYKSRTSHWGVFSTETEELDHYYSQLHKSSLIISHFSTAIVEAGLLKVPSLIPKVPFCEASEISWRLDHFEHCNYLEQMPGSFVTRSMIETRDTILTAIRGKVSDDTLNAHFISSERVAKYPTFDLLVKYENELLDLARHKRVY